MVKISLNITEEQLERLRRIALKEGSSYSEVIRQFIADGLGEKERRIGISPLRKEINE